MEMDHNKSMKKKRSGDDDDDGDDDVEEHVNVNAQASSSSAAAAASLSSKSSLKKKNNNNARKVARRKHKTTNKEEDEENVDVSKEMDRLNKDLEDLEFEDAEEDEIEEEIPFDGNKDDEDDDGLDKVEEEEEAENHEIRAVFRPGIDKLEEDEELDYDPSTYIMLHRLHFDYSCFSFEFLRDNLGAQRTKFPASCFLVAGTQAPEGKDNQLVVARLADMNKTWYDENKEDDDDDDDEDDEVDDDPTMEVRIIKHIGGVNRVRSVPQRPDIVASWSDTGKVFLWDISSKLRSLNYYADNIIPDANSLLKEVTPLYTFKGHKDEGYAMDWSKAKLGRLATGDCKKNIFVWDVSDSGINVDSNPISGHASSVEDLQWSPTEETVLASCSSDQTVKIWDLRQRKSHMLSIRAHETDVNVISWNPMVTYLLVSGSDDGSFKVWDLRKFKETESIGHFKWHTGPITSIAWHPHDESVLAVSGDDNQTSVWDLALEDDPEHAQATEGLDSTVCDAAGNPLQIPPQLLFLHQGQSSPKDVRFHEQIPGLIGSTAEDGFDAFICEPLNPKGHKLI